MPVSLSIIHLWDAIILAGLLAGFLDGAAALILFKARGAKKPLTLFQYIASAVYGKEALTGGGMMIVMGVLFHLFIAMSWVAIYFLVFPYIKWLDLYPFAGAALYGVLVWILMNLVIVRLSRAQPRTFSWPMAFANMVILILMIGMPAAYLSRSFYNC